MKTLSSSISNKQLTLLALLIALLVILGAVSIPMPAGLSITFSMIPVAIAAISMGVPGGAFIGGIFGLISFLQCFSIPPFIPSAMGMALVGINPFLAFIQRFISRVLGGITTALVYRVLKRRNVKDQIAFSVTGFASAFFNTLFFMSLLVMLFSGTDYMQEKIAGQNILLFCITFVGINAVVEMIVAPIVTAAVGMALKKSKLI